MARLLVYIVRRIAPRVGWSLALLSIAAAWSPSIAANEGALSLPSGLIFWAGSAGVLIGLRAGRTRLPGRVLLLGPVALCVLVFLVVAAGQALPPLSMLWNDLGQLSVAFRQWWQGTPVVELPELLLWRFLGVALPRFWQELQAAPAAGIPGATLLVSMAGIIATWIGAIVLGWAVARRRPSFIASQPLIGALAIITILNGSKGSGLVIGLGLLLLLAVATAHRAHEQHWERVNADYSEELVWDVLGASALVATAVLSLAFLLPTSIPSLVVDLFWPTSELPSGIAALDKQVQRDRRQPAAEVGISKLPTVSLGVSLAQDTPETLALRIKTDGPLAATAWSRYWRTRLLTSYDGRQWWANAKVSPFTQSLSNTDPLPAGAIVQDIEDLRLYQDVLAVQPAIIGLSVAANGERLPDGSLAAITSTTTGGRYRVISLPPELTVPLDQNQVPPVDLSANLAIPLNYSPRVRDLARSIVGQKASALEKAIALESYLRNLPYTYTVRPVPAEGDAVDQFLFEMREGYCTYYASAMVVMARSLGIPARVAIGYATGSYDSAFGGYVVREADAHAWPELLIDGRWLPFEPTPIQPLPARQPATTVLATPIPDVEPRPVVTINLAQLAWLGFGLLAGTAVLLGGWVLLRRKRYGPLDYAQQTLEQIGAQAHIAWPAGATLHEYAQLIEEQSGSSVEALRELVLLLEQARYSKQRLNLSQIQQLQQVRAHLAGWARQNMRKKK